ncbi:MAG: flagellar motor component MotA, partial [Gammaproteobacteria bacterium]
MGFDAGVLPAFGIFTALFGTVLFFWALGSPGTLGTLFAAVTLFLIWGG